MYRKSGLSAVLFGLLAVTPAFAQQPKFDIIADVHVSPTARNFAQNFGGVLREGRYVNRDATMRFNSHRCGIWRFRGHHCRGTRLGRFRRVRCDCQSSGWHNDRDRQFNASGPAGRAVPPGDPQ